LDKSISSAYFKSLFCVIFILTLALYSELAHSAQVSLQWNPVVEADGYKVYVGTFSRDDAGFSGYNYDTGDPAIGTSPFDAANATTYTSELPPGTYYFAVTAYNNYGESGYSTEVGPTTIAVSDPPTSVSLTSDFASPQPEGTTVTFTGQADGGSGYYEYRFFLKDPLGQWSEVREYSLEPTYTWTAAGDGESAIQVWARNAGSVVDYSVLNTITFSTAMNPPTSVSLTSDFSSPQAEGTTVTFTGQADGGSGYYQYKFLLRSTDGIWSIVQDYSSSNSYTWNATDNIDSIGVHARNEGSNVIYQVYNTIPFRVDSTPSAKEPSDSVMYVSDIIMSIKKRGANVNAKAKIIVKDNSGTPVEGAIVYGSWSGLTGDSDSSVTDVNSIVLLESDRVKKASGIFTFTVDNITKDGWSYDYTSNIETTNSITAP
jgi:hypothetical protein